MERKKRDIRTIDRQQDRQGKRERERRKRRGLFLMGWNRLSPFFREKDREREREKRVDRETRQGLEESICQWRSGEWRRE